MKPDESVSKGKPHEDTHLTTGRSDFGYQPRPDPVGRAGPLAPEGHGPDAAPPYPPRPVISVSSTEPLEPNSSSLILTDEQGTKRNSASSSAVPNDPKTLTLNAPKLKPGDYLVHWVSVAPDGHRMEGEYKFTVKQ